MDRGTENSWKDKERILKTKRGILTAYYNTLDEKEEDEKNGIVDLTNLRNVIKRLENEIINETSSVI